MEVFWLSMVHSCHRLPNAGILLRPFHKLGSSEGVLRFLGQCTLHLDAVLLFAIPCRGPEMYEILDECQIPLYKVRMTVTGMLRVCRNALSLCIILLFSLKYKFVKQGGGMGSSIAQRWHMHAMLAFVVQLKLAHVLVRWQLKEPVATSVGEGSLISWVRCCGSSK